MQWLVEFWCGSSNHGCPYCIGRHIKEVDSHLLQQRPPHECSHVLRSLQKRIISIPSVERLWKRDLNGSSKTTQQPVPQVSNTSPPTLTPPSTSTPSSMMSRDIMRVLLEVKGTLEKVADLLRDKYSEVQGKDENDDYIVGCNQVIRGFVFTL